MAKSDKIPSVRLTVCVRAQLAKPLNCKWDELGGILRDQRAVVHRLANAALLGAVVQDTMNRKLPAKHPERLSPRTAAYRAAGEELTSYRAWAAKSKDKTVRDRFSEIQIPGGTQSAIAEMAMSRFTAWKRAKGDAQLADFRRGCAIPLRAQETKVVDRDGTLVLRAKLTAGRGGDWIEIALVPSRGDGWSLLRDGIAGKNDVRIGALTIKKDRRTSKWFAMISVSQPLPTLPSECDPNNVLVVHRGQHNLITVMSSTGQWKVVASGRKLRDQKRRLARRRLDAKRIPNAERGSGAKGHGVNRRYALPDALAEKERNVIKTTVEQAWAEVVKLCKRWGCGTVVIEDYGGIKPDDDRAKRRFMDRFPNYQIKAIGAHACRKSGLSLEEVSAEYISSECPNCGNLDTSQHNHRGVFHCRRCGFDRLADWVAPLHMMRGFLGHGGEHDKRLKLEKKLADQIREE